MAIRSVTGFLGGLSNLTGTFVGPSARADSDREESSSSLLLLEVEVVEVEYLSCVRSQLSSSSESTGCGGVQKAY